MVTVSFYDDPAAFLKAGESYLAADPVASNVVSVYADRRTRGPRRHLPFEWYALLHDGAGGVVGAAMRTAPEAPHPLYVLAMPDEAARQLAGALYERDEHPGGANGTLPAATVFAHESVRLWGGRVELARASRMWELGTLREPTLVPGHGRLAGMEDLPLCRTWLHAFPAAVEEQAGRPRPSEPGSFTDEDIVDRIATRRIVLWQDGGRVVHLSGLSYPVSGVGRIGPVYTPPEHRGRGYASAAVALASQLVRDAGGRVCLATDLANPTSNKIYAALGYEPALDTANYLISRSEQSGRSLG